MTKFSLSRVKREWNELRRFRRLPQSARSIVFYAEDATSWVHFEGMVRALASESGRGVCYVTSSPADPVLTERQPGINPFYVGEGAVRTAFFLQLRADVAVMTMPDLGTYQVKRSMVHPVHYVYVFHSLVSTHMAYRPGAFDQYDTILCAGPHHVRELRAAESEYGLAPKNLVEHGYGRLDALMQRWKRTPATPIHDGNEKAHVLVAPSWGPSGLLESHGAELCHILLSAGFRVTVRPHPLTLKAHPGVIRRLRDDFGTGRGFDLETDVASSDSFASADIMISDWSGAALEFAFALERPVLFVDVPRKINNPRYEEIPLEPREVTIRGDIGEVISPEILTEVPGYVKRLRAPRAEQRDSIRRAREGVVYNLGTSGAAGAACIGVLADDARSAQQSSVCPAI